MQTKEKPNICVLFIAFAAQAELKNAEKLINVKSCLKVYGAIAYTKSFVVFVFFSFVASPPKMPRFVIQQIT